MRHNRTTVGAPFVALADFAAACAGDDGDEPTGPAPTTEAPQAVGAELTTHEHPHDETDTTGDEFCAEVACCPSADPYSDLGRLRFMFVLPVGSIEGEYSPVYEVSKTNYNYPDDLLWVRAAGPNAPGYFEFTATKVGEQQ